MREASHESENRSEPPRREPVRGLIAWALYDWANSAFPTVILTFVFSAYFIRRVAANEPVGSAQWGSALGLAGIVVAIGGPILGAVADQAGRRKPWIILFTFGCVGATGLLWFVQPSPRYGWLALSLMAIAVISAEYGGVFYNAMLPSLAGPARLGRWSGWAWSLGYAGGLACLVIAWLGFVQADRPWFALERQSAAHVRATFVLVAVWYLVFALPLFVVTPDVPATGKTLASATREGLGQLRESLGQVRRHGRIVRFLLAHMIYVDGLGTLFGFGGVYAASTFEMTEEEVLMFGIGLNITAGIGAAAFGWVDDWIGGKRTILVSLAGLTLATALALLVESKRSFWGCGLALGAFVGPVQAASRSFLARIAPAELRNQMFGLYALSGKATAFLGPLLVGGATLWSGSQRVGMATILVFFALGFGLLWTVPSAQEKEGAS